MTNIKKDTRSEYGISLAVGVITAIAGFLLAYNIGILIAISSATLWAFFGFFAAEFLKYASKQKSEREDFLNQMDVKIDTRVGTILEYSALHSKKLEETLVKLRNTSEKRKWIIAKFISRKLSDDFSSLKIEIDGDSYSNFSRNLYSECEHSIHVTSPFAPEDWFRALNLNKNGTLQKIRDGGDVSRDRILSLAPHLKAFMDSPAEIKKRLVVLSDADWKVLNDKEYLFSWDNVPGIDSDKLSKYLKDYHNISWVENEEFDKPDDGKTIRVFKDENSSTEITVDEAEENATLKISDGGIHNLTVKKENGKLNIYDKGSLRINLNNY